MESPERERAVNAPTVVLLVVATLVGLFAIQSQVVGTDAWNARFGLTAADLTDGRAWTLISYMGAHGSWLHVLSNAFAILAFGTPLARRLGSGPRGIAAWLGFFLIGGVVSGLLTVLIKSGSPVILVGASGAGSALIGAATRLMNRYHQLEPLFSRRVLTMTAVWVGANLLIAVLGGDPATGVRGIAWEAHLFGLALGLILVGPWLRLFAPRAPVPAPPGLENRPGPWGSA